MTKNLGPIGIIGLVIVAAVLGYTIIQQQKDPSSNNQPASTNQQSTPQTSTDNPTTTNQPSAEEIAVLNFPGPNATQAEKKEHSDLVNKLGNQSGFPFLDITGCRPNPVVYRVRLDGTFKVKNSDQIDHTIYTAIKTTIKADSEQTLNSKDIGVNLGDYAYGCDGSSGNVGIIQITPN